MPYESPYELVRTADGALARAKPLPGLVSYPRMPSGWRPTSIPDPLHTQADTLGAVRLSAAGAAPRSRPHSGTRLGVSGMRPFSSAWPVAHCCSWRWCAPRLGDRSRPHAQSNRAGVPLRGLAARRHAGGGGCACGSVFADCIRGGCRFWRRRCLGRSSRHISGGRCRAGPRVVVARGGAASSVHPALVRA